MATQSEAGAPTGFALLRTSLLTFPLTTAVQEVCDRTPLATGNSLGELLAIRWHTRAARFLSGSLLVALIGANALNIAADLVAVGADMPGCTPARPGRRPSSAAVTALATLGSFERTATISNLRRLPLLAYFAIAVVTHHPGRTGLPRPTGPRLDSLLDDPLPPNESDAPAPSRASSAVNSRWCSGP